MIVAEQSTEAIPPHHVSCLTTYCFLLCDQLGVEPLMIALVMIMGKVLLEALVGFQGRGICRGRTTQLLLPFPP